MKSKNKKLDRFIDKDTFENSKQAFRDKAKTFVYFIKPGSRKKEVKS